MKPNILFYILCSRSKYFLLSYLSIEAGVTEAEKEAGGESQGLIWLDESSIYCLSKWSILRDVCQHQAGIIFIFHFSVTHQHTEGLPVREETENEAQEDDWMSAPLDCQEAKESKDKATDDLSSCYKDRTDGSQSLPILSKPYMI